MSQLRFTSTIFLFLTLLFHAYLPICTSLLPTTVDLNLLKHSEINDAVVITKRVCTKTIGECLTDPEMMMMDSESNRRVLAMQKKYISYDTLKRDMVPCDRPGASYYNCHRRQANPYSRGCEVITACVRGAQEINT
ncbi:protein RALF-like 22 [Medicago truncatula]|uniref:RALF n=2 Tax=Medicago truncatula TaxID=3880 RepID=G7JAS2_MEDTR|nr:protein RALF-like 22 [Medicago truncatula]AES71939.1 RALF [Medicago truncatula]